MLFLRSWLEDYIDLSAISNTDLAKKITAFSMEVEEVKEISDYYNGLVVVGQINDPQRVEGSDKLWVFKVDLGDRHIQIVSAAPNVVDKMYVAVALSGAKLPRGYNIAERKMMGHVTQGMCLGKSELCLEEGYSSGLWEIENEVVDVHLKNFLGKPISQLFPNLFPLETVFDIKVLPNSMGILSNHLGLAYDLALVYKDFSILKPNAKTYLDFEKLSDQAKKSVELKIGQNDLSFSGNAKYSHFFTMYELSLPDGEFVLPTLIAQRMLLIQQNSVSPLVDISNYLVFDIGQPTHFYSKAKLKNLVNQPKINITIDEIKENTPFEGLGQIKNKLLSAGTVLIQANQIPIGLYGICGGVATSIDHGEKDLYLEIATFDPEEVAKNSFKLGFDRSQANRVFAGGVPSLKILITLVRLREILGGILFENLFLASSNNFSLTWEGFISELKASSEIKMSLDSDFLSSKIGKFDDSFDLLGTLKKLGKIDTNEQNADSSKFNFIPNQLYTNYEVKEDIVADLARLNDLTKIKSQSLDIKVDPHTDKVYRPFTEIKNFVASLGFTETINRPFISKQVLEHLGTEDKSLLILNPIRSQEPYIRTGLIDSLLQVVKKNLESGQTDLSIFEINKIYTKIDPNDQASAKLTQNVQSRRLLGLLTTELETQELTTVMHQILQKFNQKVSNFSQMSDTLALNGYFGETLQIKVKIFQVNNLTKKKFGLPISKNINYLEFDLTSWDGNFQVFQTYREDKEYPDLKRSISLFIPKKISFESVKSVISNLELLKELEFELAIDGLERINASEEIEMDTENTESNILKPDILNLSLIFNHAGRTIKGSEVDSIEEAILTSLQEKIDKDIVRR